MAQDFSFDTVSKVDLQAVEDAVHTALKEITTRFDFKGSISNIELNQKDLKLVIHSDDEYKLKSVWDILKGRLIKRGASIKNFTPGTVEHATGATVRQSVAIQQGIPTEKAKEMVQEIKRSGLKVQASIQSDQLRVSGRSKDDLQAAMSLLRSKDFGLELQFSNYR